MTGTPKQTVWGRWVVLAAFVLGLYLFTGFFGIGLAIPVVMPAVVLPTEPLSGTINTPFGEFFLSGTLVARSVDWSKKKAAITWFNKLVLSRTS